MYTQLLSGNGNLIAPTEAHYGKHVYHIYAIRVKNRDGLIAKLGEKEIGTNIHYPVPVHLQQAYSSMGLREGSFPVAERCASEFVSLPMFPELSAEQIKYVCDEVTRAL
jgi:dTDP-4-amino-4,6-dideoxygalactose transaminase